MDQALAAANSAAVKVNEDVVVPGVREHAIEPLCRAIRCEDDPEILARLLHCTYAVLEFAPAALLSVVEAKRDTILARPISAAPVLALLGHAAYFNPGTVYRLPPAGTIRSSPGRGPGFRTSWLSPDGGSRNSVPKRCPSWRRSASRTLQTSPVSSSGSRNVVRPLPGWVNSASVRLTPARRW